MASRRTIRLAWIAVGVLALALATGCGGEADEDDEPSRTVAVALSEWAVKATPARGKAGDVTFEVSNKGQTVHEVVIARTELLPDKLPIVSAAVDEKLVPSVGRSSNIDPGKAETKAFNLQPGKYVLYCNIPAHYGQGMYTAFAVVE